MDKVHWTTVKELRKALKEYDKDLPIKFFVGIAANPRAIASDYLSANKEYVCIDIVVPEEE